MSEAKRFFIDQIAEEVVLEGEEFLHAKNVLRIGEGDEIVLLDNSGKEYSAIVSKVEKRSMTAHVIGEREGDKEAPVPVKVIFGYLKNADNNEFVVQKCTELGVKEIVVFSSKYSSAYMNENKLERLNKVARESAKQCMRSVAPAVTYCDNLLSALRAADGYQNKLFACEFLEQSDFSLKGLSGATAIVVGSEGGFSQEEFLLSKELGFVGVSLGKRILRAETAAVALCAVVSYEVGNLER